MNIKVEEICKECGDKKVLAISKVREALNLGLVDAKALVDDYYKHKDEITNSLTESEVIEISNSLNAQLTITSGSREINTGSQVMMYQTPDGAVSFSGSQNKYYICDYSWSGPQYRTVTHSHTEGNTQGKTKLKGRLLGDVVGSVLLTPGVGTVIGAAHGTGNKKSKSKSNSQTITYDEQNEIDTPATIKLKNIDTGQIVGITIVCNSYIDSEIRRFTFEHELQISPNNTLTAINDPYEEIKKAKELLDMGILTQEEFDAKKKELLGL